MLKAYNVHDGQNEAYALIFAKTPAAAKAHAHGTSQLCDCEWIDLRATRIPHVDKFADEEGEGESYSSRVMYEAGWFQFDDDDYYFQKQCKKCKLHQWIEIPESQLNEDRICKKCEDVKC